MILPKRFQVTDLLLIYGGDAVGTELRVVVVVPFQREFRLEVVAFVESTGQLSHLTDTVDSHLIEGLQSRADAHCHIGCPTQVHVLQLLSEVLLDVLDVVLLEYEYDHRYVDEEQRDDDEHEAEDDLRPQSHLTPLGVAAPTTLS